MATGVLAVAERARPEQLARVTETVGVRWVGWNICPNGQNVGGARVHGVSDPGAPQADVGDWPAVGAEEIIGQNVLGGILWVRRRKCGTHIKASDHVRVLHVLDTASVRTAVGGGRRGVGVRC